MFLRGLHSNSKFRGCQQRSNEGFCAGSFLGAEGGGRLWPVWVGWGVWLSCACLWFLIGLAAEMVLSCLFILPGVDD